MKLRVERETTERREEGAARGEKEEQIKTYPIGEGEGVDQRRARQSRSWSA